MHFSFCRTVLLASACMATALLSWGQQGAYSARRTLSTDVGVTLNFERAYIAPGSCNCFWLKGGGADMTVTFGKGLGIAASLTGDHASNAAPGIDVNKITYVFGPRYTFTPSLLHGAQLFGEGLFGEAHAFNSSFPSPGGLKSSANSFAMQIGGGLQFPLAGRFTVRALQADYVRTALPNNDSNVQNDLRLGFGVSFHLGSSTVRH